VVPETAENFRPCANARRRGSATRSSFHPGDPPVHVKATSPTIRDRRQVDYGNKFKDENFKLKHDRRFLSRWHNAGRTERFAVLHPTPLSPIGATASTSSL